jgi:hypothetical protein
MPHRSARRPVRLFAQLLPQCEVSALLLQHQDRLRHRFGRPQPGTFLKTTVVVSRSSVMVVVPDWVSPCLQMTHFMAFSS